MCLKETTQKKRSWCRKWDPPASRTTLLAVSSSLPLLHFVAFSLTEIFYKPQCNGPRRGKQLRTECEFIYRWQARWERPVLQCKLSRHAYLMYFLAVVQWNRIMLLSGKQFHFISLASRDRTEEQLWLFAECCMEIKRHQAEISV